MHRYSAASGGGVNNSVVGGASARENTRADSSFSSSNFSLNSRRQSQLAAYKLKCDKEPLNSRLGPPDFFPQTPNCPEETLTREYLQSGYKETVEGIEEAREITLSQASIFSKPEYILKCKEALRKRLRAINESRAQKRKAGQVYGVPLSGQLLIKPGAFPEQRPCSEDFRRKWIEALSQQHKPLRSLAEHVPHGYRRTSLFEVLIRYNVPLIRATWFVKVTYLNQVRPTSASGSSAVPDKQFTRVDLWTKDVIEYLQHLLENFFPKEGSNAATPNRDQSSQSFMVYQASRKGDFTSTSPDGEEPSLHFKWWYMLRLIQWHFAEGLLLSSLIIEWVFNQLQEKDSAEALELLFPILVDLIECIALSQTYVRMLVDLSVRSINNFSSTCSSSFDTLRKPPLVSALIEIIRHLILVVPDTFVALDCFPLPSCVVPDLHCKDALLRLQSVDNVQFEMRDAYLHYLSSGYVVSSIQKRTYDLAKIVNPGLQARGAAKVVQALDKALLTGDVRFAYNSLFEDLSDVASEGRWISEVSPCLRSSLKWIGTTDLSLICSVFFLCEWATCDYRDCRTAMPQNMKLSGRKDFSQIYFAVLLLKLKMGEMLCSTQSWDGSLQLFDASGKNGSNCDTSQGGSLFEHSSGSRDNFKSVNGRNNKRAIFQSPGPLHDILVCWLDQHETSKARSFRGVEVLLMELIRNGIFYPQVYVRQLIVSGIMEKNENSSDLERRRRHHRILKQLPGSCMYDVLEEARIADFPLTDETVSVYSSERRLFLHGVFNDKFNHLRAGSDAGFSFSPQKDIDHHSALGSCRHAKRKDQVAELKVLISRYLRLPYCQGSTETLMDDSKGTLKRMLGSNETKVDLTEGTTGCEECKRGKRQKIGDDKNFNLQGFHSNNSDDEDTWWVRKGPKSQEPFKADLPLKSSKHASRSRQKTGRKTQSLAQLAATSRIESSQGASTSHVCDNKVSCPHHKSVNENEAPKDVNRILPASLGDIGKALKKLRLLERRSITIWLLKLIKQLVEGNEKPSSKVSTCTDVYSLPADGKSTVRWRLGEDELLSILYILDISCDLVSVARFLIWLLPRSLSGTSSTGQSGRNIMLSRNRENQVCQFGEPFLFLSLQRYENVLLAADLLPEVLTAVIHRSMSMTSSGVRPTTVGFAYARYLLRKYRDVPNVAKWEKNFRARDQRLLTEIDFGRSVDGDFLFSSGVPTGGEDTDEHIRQKMSARASRSDTKMKELVQLHVEEAVHYYYGKERKFPVATARNHTFEKWDDSYQIAQNIVLGLLDYIRQNGGATPDADPSTVVSAVSAITSSVGLAVAKLADLAANSNNLNCARHILQIHIFSLCLLKEALGDRVSRVFEIVFAAEASIAISGAFASTRGNRSQFQPSPETNDMYQNHANEHLNNCSKLVGRATKAAAAVSALVVGAIVHGVSTLDRMLTAFRLREGLDVLQFIRSARSTSNGICRSSGTMKQDNCIEVYVHLFRLLVGNCRTIFDGLIADVLGESYILALSRMQHRLPLHLAFVPAYSIFAMVIWRPYIPNSNIAAREDVQLYQYLSMAIGDVIRHKPFRDLIFRNVHGFYDILASDSGDSEFAAMLELHNPDKHLKTMAFVPTRARLFTKALLDCKMPGVTLVQEDGSRGSGPTEPRAYTDNEAKLSEQLVHVLDTLQPAKFHWQWIELRLLLNEQALIEKIETHSMSFLEAIRSSSPTAENFALSESEKKFTEIILTRLLARPDAASLYSEVVHLLGKLLQESLVMDIKWILAGPDVLLGRKSIRQQLMYVAQRKGLSTKAQFWKPWGWSSSTTTVVGNRGDKRKLENVSIEEGEVVDESIDVKKSSRIIYNTDAESFTPNQYITEKALAELILPCIDRSSSDLRNSCATDFIKQIGAIEQQISLITRTGKAGVVPSGIEGSSNKGGNRKGIRGGSPVLGRRQTGLGDSSPASAAALKASIWLRLQFLIRLLPLIYVDREPPPRNMRQMLSSIILRLLGTRVVYEDAELSSCVVQISQFKGEAESLMEASLLDHSSDSLFDRLLSVLYGLLSSCKASWLKPKSASKSTVKSPRDFSVFDREAAESLQTDLDRMELPATIRRRIQAAMPVLVPSLSLSAPCHPPTLSSGTLAAVQSSSSSGLYQRIFPPARTSNNPSGRSKSVVLQDVDLEIDPWTLLEDGTGSASASNTNSNMGGLGGDNANLKACSWLKGAVRVRRTDLTYIGAMDEDS